MKVNILYFAQLSEKLGFTKEEFDIPDNMGSDALIEKLRVKYHELKDLEFAVSVNQTIVKTDTPLKEGIEIALLPPFAGG
ncbi:MAG: molybdopterin synthase sulfur carrier subunit [Arenicella sp.]|jgi:molybdopterin synthase sulfur carrier subunit